MSTPCCGAEKPKFNEKIQAIHDFYTSAAKDAGPYAVGNAKFSPSGPTDKIIELANELKSEVVLDLGCGMGGSAIRVSEEVPSSTKVVGIDFVAEMIEKANATLAEAEQSIQDKTSFYVNDVHSAPYFDSTFDLIFSECVLNLTENRMEVISNAYRMLQKGGYFIYTDFVSFADTPNSIKENLKLVSGCRAGSVPLSQNISELESIGFEHFEIFNFTDDKNKRYEELRAESEEMRSEWEKFVADHPETAEFLENKIGYYVIMAKK
ncbi:class I SAM-dependent methyltransferase [Pseudoalteromonas rubra]|uniref:Class I SAM-dependent methyltransferase n=1 Tax=Pseudoalteromonas rubra TaxID=43658 RepID=A0A4Q7E830_9GAMM|nr:putative arsinothricin biosynthesis methyltransferase ArsM [Pseudoalteromonas rubra]RZM78446.1 class I SAM-dependent methyltransferase [Pseudoalteromonas rubra]